MSKSHAESWNIEGEDKEIRRLKGFEVEKLP